MNCKGCVRQFNTVDSKPQLIIPCGHTYCFNCLENLPAQKCPDCKQSIQQRRTNLFILELIDTDSIIKQKVNEYLNEIEQIIKQFYLNYKLKKNLIKNHFKSDLKSIAKFNKEQLNRLRLDVVKINKEIECNKTLLEDDLLNQIQLIQMKDDLNEIKMNLMLKMEQLERVNLLETQPPTSIDTLRKRNHSNQMNQYCLKKKRLTDQSDQSFSFCTDLLDDEENEVLKRMLQLNSLLFFLSN